MSYFKFIMASTRQLRRTKYRGQWDCDEEHGHGLMSYGKDDEEKCYDGQWQKGIMHGVGIMKWKNGDVQQDAVQIIDLKSDLFP